MNSKRLSLNAILSIGEHLTNVITLVLLNKYLIYVLGIKVLGLWTIFISIMSLTNVGTSGFAGGLVKFVAQYQVNNRSAKIIKTIETCVLAIFVIIGISLLVIYLLFVFFHSFIFNNAEYQTICQLMPWMFTAFFGGIIGRVYLSAIDGLHLIYVRNIITMIAKIVYFVLAIIFIRKYGILGVAIAFVFQNFIMYILGVFYLKFRYKNMHIFLIRFDKQSFLELYSYGYKFQIISVAQMFIEMGTTILLKTYGSLKSVGYYGLAYSMLNQLRSLVVVVVDTFVPIVASIKEIDKNKVNVLYNKIFGITVFVSLLMLSSILLLTPMISKIWLGEVVPQFISFSLIISLTFFINLISVPAYIFNLGTGNLKSNMYAFIVAGILNIILANVLGKYFNEFGVIWSWAISGIVLALIVIILYSREEKMSHLDLFKMEDLALIGAVIVSLVLCLYIYKHNTKLTIYITTLVFVLIYMFITSYNILTNRNFKYLLSKIRKGKKLDII